MSKKERMKIYHEKEINEWDQVWESIIANKRDKAIQNEFGTHNRQNTETSIQLRNSYSKEKHTCSIGFSNETGLRESSGHNGICNFSRGIGSHCNFGYNDFSSETSGIMGRNRKRHKWFINWLNRGREADKYFRKALAGFRDNTSAQSTVEYAVVMAAGLAIVIALGALTNAAEDGIFVQHAVAAASHNINGLLGGIADVFSY